MIFSRFKLYQMFIFSNLVVLSLKFSTFALLVSAPFPSSFFFFLLLLLFFLLSHRLAVRGCITTCEYGQQLLSLLRGQLHFRSGRAQWKARDCSHNGKKGRNERKDEQGRWRGLWRRFHTHGFIPFSARGLIKFFSFAPLFCRTDTSTSVRS